MSIITETAIVRPPFHESVLHIPGLVMDHPHANRYYTDRITPPSGTLNIDGDLIVDGSITCDPLYVDNVYERTAGHNIVVHDPLDSDDITLGSHNATVLDLDTTMTSDSTTRITSQHATKTYIDSRLAGGVYFAPPIYNDATVVSVKNNISNTVTAISTDGAFTSDSDTLIPSQKAVVTYAGNHLVSTIRTGGTINIVNGTQTMPTGFRISKSGNVVCLSFIDYVVSILDDSTIPATGSIPLDINYLPTRDGGVTFDSYDFYMYATYDGFVMDLLKDAYAIVTITGGLAGGITPTLYVSIRKNASGDAFPAGTTEFQGTQPCIRYLHY